MKKKTKGTARTLLAANVEARMVVRYRGKPSTNARILQLVKESGVGRRTIQRILAPEKDENDVTLGTIEDLAQALRCEVYELFQEPDPENE